MLIRKKPFEKHTLDEEKKNNTLLIRINDEERKVLDDFKEKINQTKDGTALKIALFFSNNVYTTFFSDKIGMTLFKKRKKKYNEAGFLKK